MEAKFLSITAITYSCHIDENHSPTYTHPYVNHPFLVGQWRPSNALYLPKRVWVKPFIRAQTDPSNGSDIVPFFANYSGGSYLWHDYMIEMCEIMGKRGIIYLCWFVMFVETSRPTCWPLACTSCMWDTVGSSSRLCKPQTYADVFESGGIPPSCGIWGFQILLGTKPIHSRHFQCGTGTSSAK